LRSGYARENDASIFRRSGRGNREATTFASANQPIGVDDALRAVTIEAA
jgi:hypothetical protein